MGGVQSGGGGEKPWNHERFIVTDESEQIKYFEITNNSVVSEILVQGKALFDSYDGLCVFIGSDCVTLNMLTNLSATKCYVGIHITKAVDIWAGLSNVSEYNDIKSLFNNIQRPDSRSNGVGNITIGSRWKNKIFQTGTEIDVYWR